MEVLMTTQVILEFRAKPDYIEKVRRWLKGVLPDTRSFDGCVTLHVVQNQEDPASIVIIEQWDSRQHYEKYLAWRTERGDMKVFGDMMDGPPTIRFFDSFRV
jgi:quinol monooxygenase YgiN